MLLHLLFTLSDNYVSLGGFFEITADILQILKGIDEPLGESNTERRIKISSGISEETTK